MEEYEIVKIIGDDPENSTEESISQGQEHDDNESGSDSYEEVELEDAEIWNPSDKDLLKNSTESTNDNEEDDDAEVISYDPPNSTKACSNPTASEIVMHDHTFMRKYKSNRFQGKTGPGQTSQPVSAKIIKSPLQLQPAISLASSQKNSMPSQNSSIPNVILTTMDGQPFHLAPGSQIFRFIGGPSSGTVVPSAEDVVQPVGYQLISSPSNSLEVASNNQNTNILKSILSNNGVNSENSNKVPIISKVISTNSDFQMNVNTNEQSDPNIQILNPEVIQLQNLKQGPVSISQSNTVNVLPSEPLRLEGSLDGDQVQRFMYLAGLCRVCLLRKDHVTSIFVDVNIGPNGIIENSRGPHAASRYNIISALKTLLDVDVYYGDGLPENICIDCLDNLMSFSVFRKKISIGQTKLNEIIAQVQGTPNITLINDMGEKDMRKTDVFRHSDSIIRANEMIKTSSFSHCAIRYLPDRVLDKIFTAMSAMVGFKSGKLKELEMYAINEPYITAWYCYTCNLTIHGSHDVYAQHFVEVHEINDAEDVLFPCDVCGSSFSLSDCTGMSQNYAEHWLQHLFFHQCNICLKKMPSIKGMWVHKRSAHSSTDKIYQCNICDKAFSKKAHLDAHKRTHLDPEDRKQHLNWCKICGKGLTSSLAAHMSSVHSEERPWKCEICNKGFKRKEILNGHRSTVHYNVKKYQCELCGVFLKSHSSKAQHLLRHKGEKAHTCSVCDKSFYSAHALRSHALRHKESGDNQCSICSKIFKRKIYLTEHMRLHTGEKPHECHICGKQIRMKSNYYKHMKIHQRRAFESKETVDLEDVELT